MTNDQARHYRKLLRKGFPPEKALEIATGPFAHCAGVALRTSTRFLAGVADPFTGHDSKEIQIAKEKAARAGVSIAGKKYSTQLASEPWDPNAWYNDPFELRKKCIESGRSYDGYGGKVAARPLEKDPWEEPYQVRESIVEEDARQFVEEEKLDLTPKEAAQLKDELRTRYSGGEGSVSEPREAAKKRIKSVANKGKFVKLPEGG